MKSSIESILGLSKRGYLYGSKLRLAHSFTLLIIFAKIKNSKDLKTRLLRVLSSSQKHGLSLTLFAGVYKLLLIALAKLQGNPPTKSDYFLSAFVSGYLVFGNQILYFSNGISQQITLYILSRVMIGMFRLLSEKIGLLLSKKTRKSPKDITKVLNNHTWNVVAALSWGLVMVLWKFHRNVLNSLMLSSMDHIYSD